MPVFEQLAEMLFQSVAVGAHQPLGFGHGDAPVIARQLRQLRGQFWQVTHHQMGAFNVGLQPCHLALHGVEEKFNQGF